MYLKSLEVHGFKSFANKLVFEFHDGITAIVGPNGSGKSNVGDAVRWVLGEQSAKQLRGAKMEDIIFAGTELRRPLGFAYVAITLSNEDHKLNIPYEEVTVARRVYRSGESEYLLNGTTCRLKDINELFFDTGVGKEGYSIIGQGQIDKILSGRPDDRRELFDEAAGIVKYKKRKAETEKKLDEEHQNMIRVEDILSELEKQRGPVNSQADKARKYLAFRDELKVYDINIFLHDYDEFKKNIKNIEENEDSIEISFGEKEEEIESTRIEYEKVKGEIAEGEEHIEEIRQKISDSEIQINNFQNDIALIKEQINTVKNNEEHYNERYSSLQKEIAEKEKIIEEYQIKKEEYEKLRDELDEKRATATESAHQVRKEIKLVEEEILKKDKLIQEATFEKARGEKHREKYTTRLETNSLNKANINKKLIQNQTAIRELKEQEEIEQDIFDDMTEKIEAIDAMEQTLNETIVKFKQASYEHQAKLNKLQSDFHMENSRLLSIRNITERYEGFGQSIKRVMEQKDKVKGIHGVVADVIKTPKEYEIAIETALGGQIQNIVTDTENTARNMIEFLKKNRYGRATFLPLNSITAGKSNIPSEAFKEAGSLGLASGLVEAKSEYKNLMDYLLGRVLVIDNIDNALKIAKKYNHRIRMVTLEGELINPGGSMSGGAFKNNNNLLGRRREIEALEKKVSDLTVELRKEKEKYNENESLLEKERAKLAGNAKLKGDFQIKKNTAKVNLERIKKDITDNYSELSSIQMEKENSEAELSEIQFKVKQYDEIIEEALGRLENILTEKKECEGEKKRLTGDLDKHLKDSSNLFVKSNEYAQNAVFAADNISRYTGELKSKKHDLENLVDENVNYDSVLDDKKNQISEKKQEIKDTEEVIRGLKKELNGSIADNEDLKKKNSDFIVKRENLINEQNSLEKEKIRLSNQKEKLNEKQDELIKYMWEQYEIAYNNALELRTETELTPAEIKKKIGELKGEIKSLGEVNVGAIEQSIEINDRYELLSNQHDDIVNAADKLKGIIAELDEKMRITFTEQFAKINESFDKVFKELFGGGKGYLELVNEEDVLTSGILIVAQPPGKKLQNMMQLSGGEKALTAISLLFAIQKLKPSPFCLLDEIEAALDDSNVDRFANYLHKLTKDTQFIVITHRRGTMNAADILYGITMQEKGVSTLVSVDLVEAESMVDEKKEKKK
ncbi:MAG: chromosome segregation protein SMC [Lachnospiraceae bacterium]|nr:chromosome segregation protein SMC [Lachnospiraceae bacterium]